MSKRNSVKHKIDRRLGENIWGRPKSPLNARAYGPGQHGQRRKGKLSDYGLQLRAKQKLKGYYGSITEKAFKKLYTEAARVKGDTGERLIGLLESRLDAIVYRAKFVPTVFAARQFVSHGHVLVNGRKCDIPSMLVTPGDQIKVKTRERSLKLAREALQKNLVRVPDFLEIVNNGDEPEGRVTRMPSRQDVDERITDIREQLIIEIATR